MKRLLSLLLCACVLLGGFALAEPTGEGYPPYDYLVSLGYKPMWLDKSPGWRTCNMIGDDGYWGITISDEENSWSIVTLMDYSPGWDFNVFAKVFMHLVEAYDWDVSFFWPESESGAKMAVSYGIMDDIDKTEENFMEKEPYVEALRGELGLDTGITEPASTTDANRDAIMAEVVRTMHNPNADSPLYCAYDKDSDALVLSLQLHVDADTWYRSENEYVKTLGAEPIEISKGVAGVLNDMGIFGVSIVFAVYSSDYEVLRVFVNGYDIRNAL